MIKNRLNKMEKMLKPDIKNCHLMAFEYPNRTEKNTYSTWDGFPGSGCKKVTKEEWEAMAQKASEGNVSKFINDMS